MIIDDSLFDCMAGTIYVMKRGCHQEKFLKQCQRKKDYIRDMLAEININDIYECSVEVTEKLKDKLLKMIKYYGDSEKNIRLNYYNVK